MNYNEYIENNSLCSAVARLAIVECGMKAQYKTTKKGKYVVTDDWLDTLKLLLSLNDGDELALIYSRQSDGYTNDEVVLKTMNGWRKTFDKYDNFPFKNRIKFFIWVADVKGTAWLDNFITDYFDEHYTENLNPNYNFEQKSIL